ncbi:MAG: hypothetical protein K8R25_11975 [Methanosarcinales archaeon]|nr:hypothetical protein [Methanosarcinales archaeon]
MKFNKILIALIIMALMCIIATALPNLDHLTEEDCRECHGNEKGKTVAVHHESGDFSKCKSCHIFPLKNDFRSCFNCHVDFDHHDGAQGRCADCHEDKQKGKGRRNKDQ